MANPAPAAMAALAAMEGAGCCWRSWPSGRRRRQRRLCAERRIRRRSERGRSAQLRELDGSEQHHLRQRGPWRRISNTLLSPITGGSGGRGGDGGNATNVNLGRGGDGGAGGDGGRGASGGAALPPRGGYGGGIYTELDSVLLESCTIFANRAEGLSGGASALTPGPGGIGGAGGSGGFGGLEDGVEGPSGSQGPNGSGGLSLSLLGFGIGGGIHGSPQMRNSIVAGNQATSTPDGGSVSLGFNLIGGDPKLGPLTINGGLTVTMSPLPGSPAIGAGDQTLAGTPDQRGVIRFAPVDIGAIEAPQPPVATTDAFSVAEDTPFLVAAPGLLANDVDPEGAVLTASLVRDAAHGVVIVFGLGAFHYTPQANFSGADSFTYRASDGSQFSNEATVSVTVTPVRQCAELHGRTSSERHRRR